MSHSTRAMILAVLVSEACVLRAQELPPILFVERDTNDRTNALDGEFGSGVLRQLLPDGSVESFLEGADENGQVPEIADVLSPEVSFDGRGIAFAGFSVAERAWRIFRVDSDGRDLRQVTTSDRDIDLSRYGAAAGLFDRYDDLDPCWLPDGRLCFVSTRYPVSAPDLRQRGTNLYVVEEDGSELHRITTERFGADTPTVDPLTGEIVYSRWWLTGANLTGSSPQRPPPGYYTPPPGQNNGIDLPPQNGLESTPAGSLQARTFRGVNSWSLASLRLDGTGLRMHGSFAVDRVLSMAYRPSFLASGEVLSIFLRSTPFYGQTAAHGLRLHPRTATRPAFLGGSQTITDLPALQLVPFTYESAVELPDGRLLVTAADASNLGPTAWQVGIWVQDTAETWPSLVLRLPQKNLVDAVPLVARPLPPVLEDEVTEPLPEVAPRDVQEAYEIGGSFTFRVEDIFANGPMETGIANAPSFRSAEFIEFWMNPQRARRDLGSRPLLIRRVPVPPSGLVEVELPAGVPLFEVLRTRDEALAAGRDGQVYHVAGHNFGVAGTTQRCVGCHAGHSMQEVPPPGEVVFSNLAPGAELYVSSNALATPLGWLVDRDQKGESSWTAERLEAASIELHFPVPFRAQHVRLYAGETSLGTRMESFDITTSLGEDVVQSMRVDRDIVREGTLAELDEERVIDRVRIEIPWHRSNPIGAQITLREVEVIGAAAGDRPGAMAWYRRGDADCNGTMSLNDPVRLLLDLFGGNEMCCQAAADVDGDDRAEINDAIQALAYLFQSGPPPAEPFESCDGVRLGQLGCATASCR